VPCTQGEVLDTSGQAHGDTVAKGWMEHPGSDLGGARYGQELSGGARLLFVLVAVRVRCARAATGLDCRPPAISRAGHRLAFARRITDNDVGVRFGSLVESKSRVGSPDTDGCSEAEAGAAVRLVGCPVPGTRAVDLPVQPDASR